MGIVRGCAGGGGLHRWSCKEVEAEPLSTPVFPLTLQVEFISSGGSGPPRHCEPQKELRLNRGSPKPSLRGEALSVHLAPNLQHQRVRPCSLPGSCFPWVHGPRARVEETRITAEAKTRGGEQVRVTNVIRGITGEDLP